MRCMLRALLLFLVFSLSGVGIFAQNQWVRQGALPQPRNLTGVEWISPRHGFVVGESKTVMETLDGGVTWRSIQLASGHPDQPFYEVHFRDSLNGFIFGNSGSAGPDFWRTTDAGATWQQVTAFPTGGSWYQMDFVSASIGFMTSNGSTTRTTDGGATWSIRSDYLTCPVIYGMDFRDADTGLAGGNRVTTTDGGPGIFKTTDGGATWVRKYPQSANDILWLDDTKAIAASFSILRSTDAGETWTILSSDVTTGLDDMELLPDGTILGVSGSGDGWRSTDGGATWTRTLPGIGALPSDWAVSFFDNLLGSIVGQGGVIYKTTDGGLTWTMLNSGIGGVEFADLEMFDDNTGLAVGDNGYFLRTTNGGEYWDTGRLQVTGVVLFRNEDLKAVCVVDQTFAVAAGSDGVVYKTFDRGKTWESIGYPRLPGYFYINDVKFITRNLGYVTGNRPGESRGLYKTTDGGASWELIDLNLGHSIDFIDVNRGWVMNVGGLGYRTTNGGTTWQQMILPNQGFSPNISKIDFINENEGWAVGWYGYAAHTIDGGRTWQLQTIATQEEHILGLHVLSPTEAFAVGAATGTTGNLYHTRNAGATWTKYPVGNPYSLSAVFATASRKVWVSGFDGAVLHHPNFLDNTKLDFDGDGKADISVFRPSSAIWYLKRSGQGFTATQFGLATDKLAPADYDGDGKTDVAVFRDGDWYFIQSGNNQFRGVQFGMTGDVPVPGDYDGDGLDDIAVFRPSDGTWYLLQSQGGFVARQFGQSGDIPVADDYDGDGKCDAAVYRGGIWYLLQSRDGFTAIHFGISTDVPVASDYDGDGKADVAVFRSGVWYLQRSRDGFTAAQFGLSDDRPTPADYDGDGKTDIAVFRQGNWYIQQSASGFKAMQFGLASDLPISSVSAP